MAKLAPYEFWSKSALINEAAQRGIVLEDEFEKDELIELLKSNDIMASDNNKSDEPVDKDNESVADSFDDEEDDNNEDDKQEPEPKKDEQVVSKQEPKKKNPARKTRSSGMNANLKEKGLWKKGMQFLSKEEKEELLVAKTDEERDRLYKIADEKFSKVREKISNSKSANKTDAQEGNPYALKSLKALRKIAIERKVELKEKELMAKKTDTVDDIAEKLWKADKVK